MPKLIRDEFSAEPSRQVRYMLRKKAEGRCRACGKPAHNGGVLCEFHVAKRQGYVAAAKAKKANRVFDELV